jgi:HSP20 family protein
MSDTNIEVKRDERTAPAEPVQQRPSGIEALQALRNDMDRMLERFRRSGFGVPAVRRIFEPQHPGSAARGLASIAPAADLCEDETGYYLKAEFPGLSNSDIDVTLSGDMLTIVGHKHDERQEMGKNYHWSERQYGSFRRTLQLPPHVDRDRIEATFKNGLLSIMMPKTPEAMQPQRKIEVRPE